MLKADNQLFYSLDFTESWLSIGSAANAVLAFCCLCFIVYSALRVPQRFFRPSFAISSLSCLLYQLPLVLFSPLFYKYLPNAVWFSVAIHTVIIVNLFWVYMTPKLNVENKCKAGDGGGGYLPEYFRGWMFWSPIILFAVLLVLYFYRIPFFCTALYSLFVDRDLTLIVREIVGKLMGRSYAPHVLNVLTSAVGPIVVFLLAGRIYFDYMARKYWLIGVWLLFVVIVIVTPLLGGAKGSLVPMAVALLVIGFLAAKNWKWKILTVGSVALLFAFMIIAVKVAQESNVGNGGGYQFASCIARLGVCDKIKPLIDSLKISESSYGMSKERTNKLDDDMILACGNRGAIKQSIPADSNISSNKNQVKPDKIAKPNKGIATHVFYLLYRVFAIPAQVASWHYMYVSEYGAPGVAGISISKLFMKDYVNVPSKVCDAYESVRSGGNRVATCTAPTSYLLTYPAYLGFMGLLLACLLTIIFDIVVSLLIKYSAKPFADLAVGVMMVAVVNFIVADFTTVMISHGAGIAFAILILFCLVRFISGKKKI